MDASLLVPWDERLTAYDFGHDHPLAPVRVELTMRLARDLGVLDAPEVLLAPVPAAPDEVLELVHAPEYIHAVKNVAHVPQSERARFGLGTDDNPLFPGMHEASALVVGASVAAADAVWSGAAGHAANMAGGLHHAMRAHASGFCLYNDVAIAIARLLEQGATRVAYVDIDAHHGDGVQAAFYNDPRVLTISVHEHPSTLFPGTGLAQECGGPDAQGMAVNLALPAGTRDAHWLRAFEAVVPPLLSAFDPQILVTQHGCDSHALDPLAHLMLSVDGQRLAAEALHRLAHEHAGGRWLLFGGGGYAVVEVVPRIWTHVLAEAAHRPIPPRTETPEQWRVFAAERSGRLAPLTMSDGQHPELRLWVDGFNPADPIDREVLATRRAVFPHHGLDILF
ncbi:acetoin utilization protein AcuC [Actinocrinis puniceicyclus]|uniref:Acetoin utilization protein AcuC n=1 Tax=Actinocrinis puniceicyclus TaxID=977794 RepID=A0A8J7WNT1_9ACTN|nr:acetoin utilization protein AcuC [Actinocrinis puniceicyclus]MBS2964160.1 acetoin utilization protein AcuC [Actinocrinis puniceicyclus]